MLAVQPRWVAGMEIFLVSCLSLPNTWLPAVPALLLADLAVPSTQGHLYLLSWLGRKRSLSRLWWCTVAFLAREPKGWHPQPRVWQQVLVVWSSSAGLCHLFRMVQELTPQNMSEAQLSPSPLPL